jgi:hypothetical protein
VPRRRLTIGELGPVEPDGADPATRRRHLGDVADDAGEIGA